MRRYADDLGASAGRGTYREAIETGRILSDCRARLARLIHAEDADHVVFTHNCSWALNQAIKGWLRPGDHVVTTTMEHNSVLRPLHALDAEGSVATTYVPADPLTSIVDVDRVFNAVGPNTALIAIIHASNVTGALQPVAEIGRRARSRGIPLLVDAAQTAGHVPIDVQAMCIDFLALPGHKGLMGPLGTGALYIRPGLESRLRPLAEGGTGSISEQPVQPDFMPDKLEPGSHNAIGLAGLAAALRWLEDRSVESRRAHDTRLNAAFMEQTCNIEGLTVYGPSSPQDRVAVFSVRVDGFAPSELAALLETDFGILTRPGIHCAPLAHRTIGTTSHDGTTRLSFGAYNTEADVERCTDALRQMAHAHVAAR